MYLIAQRDAAHRLKIYNCVSIRFKSNFDISVHSPFSSAQRQNQSFVLFFLFCLLETDIRNLLRARCARARAVRARPRLIFVNNLINLNADYIFFLIFASPLILTVTNSLYIMEEIRIICFFTPDSDRPIFERILNLNPQFDFQTLIESLFFLFFGKSCKVFI